QERVFEKLFKEAEIAKLKPEDMRKYEESLKVYRDNRNTMEYAKKEAMREGREEGMMKGREEGMEQGILKGQVEVAKTMKRNSVHNDLIAKYTGLTTEQVEKLEA